MIRPTLYILLSMLSIDTSGQNMHDHIWLLGRDYDKTMEGREGVQIDFTGDTVRIDSTHIAFDMYVQNNTFSDTNGNIKFYFNGCALANGHHENIEQGFNPGSIYDFTCGELGGRGNIGAQSSISLQINDSLNYLIHQGLSFLEKDGITTVVTDKLYYSEIVSVNDSIRINKNNILLESENIGNSKLTAIKKDSVSWWIIKSYWGSNQIVKILIESGQFEFDTIEIEGVIFQDDGGGGNAKFNAQGDVYATISPQEGIFLFDFERETGNLSLREELDIPFEYDIIILDSSLEFSPSGQFLYVSNPISIYQIDLWNDDIKSSIRLVAEFDGFIGNGIGQRTTFGEMELGPDCRIWISTGPSLPYMHVIMNPDQPGELCDVQQHAIKLPYPHYIGIPHYPNYRLDTPYPRCDSSKVLIINGVTTATFDPTPTDIARLYPNPNQCYVTIEPNHDLESIHAYDQMGNLVYKDDQVLRGKTIRTDRWQSGMYVLHLVYMDGSREVRKVMKVD